MKRVILIISMLSTIFLAGVLYGSRDKKDEVKTMMLTEAYMSQFSSTMPDVIMDPMAGFPLY